MSYPIIWKRACDDNDFGSWDNCLEREKKFKKIVDEGCVKKIDGCVVHGCLDDGGIGSERIRCYCTKVCCVDKSWPDSAKSQDSLAE